MRNCLGTKLECVPKQKSFISETEQPVGDSNLQEFMQPSSSTLNSQPANALGKNSDETEKVTVSSLRQTPLRPNLNVHLGEVSDLQRVEHKD